MLANFYIVITKIVFTNVYITKDPFSKVVFEFY